MSSLSDNTAPPAFRILTRHFLSGLCRPRVLDDDGQEGLHRVFLGALAGVVAGGLLLTRVFGVKYAAFAGMRGSEDYAMALAADTAFVLSIPMLLVAALANLHAGALFPDDTDYRVCMVLPVRRAVVFRAKLAALGIFIGAAALSVHLALLPLLMLMWGGEGLRRVIVLRLPVFLIVGAAASVAALTFVVALHGVTLSVLPARMRAATTVALRSIVMVALVVLVPLAARLSSAGAALAEHMWWLTAIPSLWFVGLEQVLIGRADAFFAQLAWRGVAALVCGVVLSTAVYTQMYRRFDSPAAATASGASARRWRDRWRNVGRVVNRPACGGVYAFTAATLWRSP